MEQNQNCLAIADQVVPEYRTRRKDGSNFTCTGHTAKRWQAAYDAAYLALSSDSAQPAPRST